MNNLVTALVDLNPTRADYANIRHALAATTERGLTLAEAQICLLYTSPSPRDRQKSRMPSSA